MITLRKTGLYKLYKTKHGTRMMALDHDSYAWPEPVAIGPILVQSKHDIPQNELLSVGHYMLYEVEAEPLLSDQQHLELEVGIDTWQGYLLPTGLPTAAKHRSRIITTRETITDGPYFGVRHPFSTAPFKHLLRHEK